MNSKNSPAKTHNSPPSPSTGVKGRKAGQLFYLLLFITFIFLFIAILTFTIDRSGEATGLFGRFGGAAASILIGTLFGRWGTLALPVAIALLLIGRFSRWKFKPWRWITIVLVTGFYVGFGTALVRHFLALPAENEIVTGALSPILLYISVHYLYGVGTALLALAVLAAFAVILFDFRLTEWLELIFYRFPAYVVNSIREFLRDSADSKSSHEEEYFHEDEDFTLSGSRDRRLSVDRNFRSATPSAKPRPPVSPLEMNLANEGAVAVVQGTRELPPLRLLDPPPPIRESLTEAELKENSRKLEEKLASLGVTAKVIKTNPGPIITRYDLEPSADVKVSKVSGLSDDIAMALRAKGIRILAPIPGEAAIGVEIPNRYPETVYVREVIGSDEFRNAKGPLTVALGKDAEGKIFLVDLARLPHLLVAGATGSGKSVCINIILLSLLYRSDPNNLRVVLVDPKKLELSLYARLSYQHLIAPRGLGEDVITTPENAVLALRSVHAEMERRYDILAEVGVRSLEEYNRWRVMHPAEIAEAEGKRPHLPYIVVIVDELADLMMSVRREFEELVVRLAQMSRAVGIHLVVATQRPSVDVVTGLIKANFPGRIAFQVAARPDSRTILDSIGAEALLGRGDMLFMGPGGYLQRAHGALATTEEVERVVDFIRSQPPVADDFVLPDPEASKIKGSVADTGVVNSADEFFEEAARIVVKVDQGSVSILQRRLRVGYSRAARLIDELEQAGIVGPFDGSKARQVLVSPDELRDRYGIEL